MFGQLRSQVFEPERLGEVAIGSQFDHPLSELPIIAAGKHDDWQIFGALVFTQFLKNLVPLGVRHFKVEQDHIGGILARLSNGICSVESTHHGHAVRLQPQLEC